MKAGDLNHEVGHEREMVDKKKIQNAVVICICVFPRHKNKNKEEEEAKQECILFVFGLICFIESDWIRPDQMRKKATQKASKKENHIDWYRNLVDNISDIKDNNGSSNLIEKNE
jgi:hypothetical protein